MEMFNKIIEELQTEYGDGYAITLRNHIKAGKKVAFINLVDCVSDSTIISLEELQFELDCMFCPYIKLKNSNFLMIRQEDVENVNNACKKICYEKSCYCQEVSIKDLNNAINNVDKITNKEMLKIEGLSRDEVDVLQITCRGIAPGFMIGVEKERGEYYSISIHSSKLFDAKTEKNDFCKAFFQMQMMVNASNSFTYYKQRENDMLLEKELFERKKSDDTFFIIAVDDIDRYMEINAKGYIYYEKGQIFSECEKTSEAYDVEIKKCLNRMYNKTILETKEELDLHLSTNQRTIFFKCPERHYRVYNNRVNEKCLVDGLNSMIKKNIVQNGIEQQGSQVVFEYYQKEASRLLHEISRYSGNAGPGYDEADFQKVRKECTVRNLDFYGFSGVVDNLKAVKGIIYKTNEAFGGNMVWQ